MISGGVEIMPHLGFGLRKPTQFLLLLVVTTLIMAAAPLHAQLKREVLEISEIVDASGWITFKENVEVFPSTVFDVHKSKFGLGSEDEMRLLKKRTSKQSGWTHYRYQQYHNGIPIEGAVFLLHERDNKVVKANGKIATDVDIETSPSITKQEALNIALKVFPSKKYQWEDDASERLVKFIKKDTLASYYPKPVLVLARIVNHGDVTNDNLRLAYKVEIMSKVPHEGYSIYIDANTGEEFRRRSLLNGCVGGQAVTTFNGEREIKTTYVSGNGYKLLDDCTLNTVSTLDVNSAEVYDADNDWALTQSQYTQTHWAGMMTYDYFKVVHLIDSYDDNNAVLVHTVGGAAVASYGGGIVEIGEPTFYSPNYTNSLDIVGHEWTHGLTEAFGGPDPDAATEFGALYESFGDIFGSMVECHGEATMNDPNITCDDFEFAEDLYPPNVEVQEDEYLMRDMCSPRLRNGADTYAGLNWSNADKYVWAGAQNKWFCLLANGSGPTPKTNNHQCSTYTYNVSEIGKERAALLCFESLTTKLGPTSTYRDARLASLEAASELQFTSGEIIAIKEAWDAVGVYEDHAPLNYEVCGNLTDQTVPNVFRVINKLEAGDVCTVPNYTTVKSSADIEFRAGSEIQLTSGFTAESGSSFWAHIQVCDADFFLKSAARDRDDETGRGLINRSRGIHAPAQVDIMPTLTIQPNPLVTNATVRYGLYASGPVHVSLHDTFGNTVITLVNSQHQELGTHSIRLEKAGLMPGLYYCALRTNGMSVTFTVVIL